MVQRERYCMWNIVCGWIRWFRRGVNPLLQDVRSMLDGQENDIHVRVVAAQTCATVFVGNSYFKQRRFQREVRYKSY